MHVPPNDATEVLAEVMPTLEPPAAEGELGRFAGYRIISVLGSGGTGVVFEAVAPDGGDRVAVKVLRPSLAVEPATRERFVRQSALLRAIRHDNLVALRSFGTARGTLYTVMQLVRGESLEARLRRVGRLDAAELLRVGRGAARALVALHAAGVIHRDVKPPNLMLDGADPSGSSGASDATTDWGSSESGPGVRLLDYGLIQWTDSQTAAGGTTQIVGTPGYVSPEQAQEEELDHRTDLFSLGCVLYRAATGTVPFQGGDVVSALLAAVDHVPPPVGQLRPDLPPALAGLIDWLMEKAPADRPDSAAAVERVLEALASGRSPRLSRPRRGRRRGFRAAAGLAALALAGAGVAFALRSPEPGPGPTPQLASEPATVAAPPAPELAPEPRVARTVVEVLGDDATGHNDEVGGLAFAPDGSAVASGGADHTIRLWDSRTGALRRVLTGHQGLVNGLAFARGGTVLVSGSFDGTVKVWDADSGQNLFTLPGHTRPVISLAVSPDGRTAASGGSDSTVRVWDPEKGREIAALKGLPAGDTALAYTADARTLLVGTATGEVVGWDLVRDRVGFRLNTGQRGLWWLGLTGDDGTLATASTDGTVKLWNLGDRSERYTLRGHAAPVTGATFVPDGRRLFTGSWDGRVIEWDVASGDPVREWRLGHKVHRLVISPDGTRVAAGRSDGRIQLLRPSADPGGYPEWGDVVDPSGRAEVAVAPDRSLTVVLPAGPLDLGGRDLTAPRVLRAVEGDFDVLLPAPAAPKFATSPDPSAGYSGAGLVACLDPDTFVRFERSLSPGSPDPAPHVSLRVVHLGRTHVSSAPLPSSAEVEWLRLSRRGDRWQGVVRWRTGLGEPEEHALGVVTLAAPTRVRVGVCAVNTSPVPVAAAFKPLVVTTGPELPALPDSPVRPPRPAPVASAPPLERVTVPGRWRTVVERDSGPVAPELVGLLGGLQYRLTGDCTHGNFSPDGKRYISTSGADLHLIDFATGELVRRFIGHRAQCCSARFSPDGGTIASVGIDRTIRLWDVATGKETRRFDAPGITWGTAFSADGKYLAVTVSEPTGALILLDLVAGTRRQVARPDGMTGVVFLPGEKALATGCCDGKVRVWSVPDVRPVSVLTHGTEEVKHLALAISPDGRRLASASDQSIRVWEFGDDPLDPKPEWQIAGGGVGLLAFTPDSESLWTARCAQFESARPPRSAVRWRARDGRQEATVALPTTVGYACFGLSPDGLYIAGAGGGDRVLWRIPTTAGAEAGRRVSGHHAVLTRVTATPDGRTIASADMHGRVLLWDLGKGVLRELNPCRGPISGLVFGPDGQTVITSSYDGTVRVSEARTGRVLKQWTESGYPMALALSPDGESLAVADWNARVAVYALNDPRDSGAAGRPPPLLQLLLGHTGGIRVAAYNSDGSMLATAGTDGTVRLWSRTTGTARVLRIDPRTPGDRRTATGLAFLPTGELVSTWEDGTVRFWSADGKPELVLLAGAFPSAVSVRADGRQMAVSGADGTIRIWNLPDPRVPRIIRLPVGDRWRLGPVEYLPDGSHLAVAGPDGLVHLLRLVEQAPPPRPVEKTGARSDQP